MDLGDLILKFDQIAGYVLLAVYVLGALGLLFLRKEKTFSRYFPILSVIAFVVLAFLWEMNSGFVVHFLNR